MTWGWNVPSPLPSSTDTVVGVLLSGDGQVDMAVAGEVARHDGVWVRPDRVSDLGLERAVAIAQQHRHRRVVVHVGDGQVEMAIAGEVTRHDAVGSRPDRVGDLGLERPVAIAQQHRHSAAEFVGDGQVEMAVAVEVARHDGDRVPTRPRK